MGEHTRGPWHWDEDVKDIGEINGPNGGMVAFVHPFASIRTSEKFGGAHYCHADARLIAAAPELLEALEGLLSATESSEGVPAATVPCEEGCSMCTAQIAARAAIAKARGTR